MAAQRSCTDHSCLLSNEAVACGSCYISRVQVMDMSKGRGAYSCIVIIGHMKREYASRSGRPQA
eukprot:10559-Eustigmatos_ZCMA.PRE.1